MSAAAARRSLPSPSAMLPALRVFAPAKINWALTIRRRREDGFHDIDTVFQTIGVGDELVCRPLAEPVCRILCADPAVPTGPENLIARAWRLLAEACPGRVGGLEVTLDKRVPMGAGMGGGSSDAAATLAAINRLYRLRLHAAKLEALAAELGSDCSFFVRGGTARGSGRGEILTQISNKLPTLWLVVVFPGFASPTAAAYGGITPAAWQGPEIADRTAKAIERGDVDVLQKSLTNVFSTVVFAADSRYKFVQDQMRHRGLAKPLLSGSGSAMFSICRTRLEAQRAAAVLASDFPWVAAAPLRHRGVGFRKVDRLG